MRSTTWNNNFYGTGVDISECQQGKLTVLKFHIKTLTTPKAITTGFFGKTLHLKFCNTTIHSDAENPSLFPDQTPSSWNTLIAAVNANFSQFLILL